MAREVAITALSDLLGTGAPVRAIVVDADWAQLAARYRIRTELPVLDEVVPETPALPAESSDTDTQWQAIQQRLRAAVAPAHDGALLGHHIVVDTAPPLHWWQASLTPGTTPYPGSTVSTGSTSCRCRC